VAPDPTPEPSDVQYTERLARRSGAWWKKAIGAQVPYRWNIRRITEGPTLDVGCGIGRNLEHLDGDGVGVDINQHSVEMAQSRGFRAHTVSEFPRSQDAVTGGYGTILFAHVLEHMTLDEAVSLVREYLPYLKPGGLVVVIVPQESGFASDPTHVSMVDSEQIQRIAQANELATERVFSFPFPRAAGRVFRHNETVALLRAGNLQPPG
jgi:2-polyprenyl-3-methyl-5-hydroxy-6-metoxy-1,4-benzoquinol methylase